MNIRASLPSCEHKTKENIPAAKRRAEERRIADPGIGASERASNLWSYAWLLGFQGDVTPYTNSHNKAEQCVRA